jgi:hypothetical protein
MPEDELVHEHQLLDLAKSETYKLRDRKLREALVRRARQLETVRQMNLWQPAPELKQSE